jgi:hypothetical protein
MDRRESSNVDHAEVASESKPPLFPDNAQFWYETQRAFGAASYGASEFGEVLVTAGRIRSGDFDSWYEEWNRIAEKVGREAADQFARGHHISARDSFLRAATYYCASEFFLHGNPRDPRITSAYERSVECYKASAKLFDPPVEPQVRMEFERLRSGLANKIKKREQSVVAPKQTLGSETEESDWR